MSKFTSYAFMYFSFLIYSTTTIFSKLASSQSFLSPKYCFYFTIIVFILGIYAILWQQILKKIELSVAMSNKPIVIVLALLWAYLFFKEIITVRLVIGCALIIVGVVVVTVKK